MFTVSEAMMGSPAELNSKTNRHFLQIVDKSWNVLEIHLFDDFILPELYFIPIFYEIKLK